MTALALRLVGGTDVGSDASASDAALLQAAARQDQQAFAVLVRRHYPIVYRVVWRMLNGHADTEDVTQDAFFALWRNPRQVKEASALRSWLIRVASNKAIDGRRRRQTTELEHAEAVVDDAPGAPQQLDQSRVSERIDQAIAALPDRQRLALTLVQFEHMSNAAAAAVMELSVDALESLLARARRNLKQHLAGDWRMMLQVLAGEDQ